MKSKILHINMYVRSGNRNDSSENYGPHTKHISLFRFEDN